MVTGKVQKNLLLLSCISLVITAAFYFINVQFFSSTKYFRPNDAFFLEGILSTIFGFLFLLGRGGINLWNVKAAILSALAGAVFDGDTVGPHESLKRDRWRPEGFPSLGLILLLAGVFMIAASFLKL